MENVKIENIKMKFCRLCFQALSDVDFKTMETLPRDMLDVLLLKQNLDEGSKYFLCNDCYEKACAALSFKSTCLDTEDTIFRYVNCEGVIDLREVYFKAKENEQLNDVFNDQQICRLCMRLFRGEYISFDEVEKYMVLIYIPELNFSATKDPVICEPCFECLGIHSRFINSCLDLAEKRKHFCDDGGVKLPVETEDIQLKFEQSEQEGNEFLIKAEEVQIKSEQVEIKLEQVEIKSEEVEVKSEEVEIKSEFEQDRPQFPSLHDVKLNEACHDTRKINCESMLLVDNDSDMGWYKCGLCEYKSKKKSHLTTHMLTHRDPSEIKWYKCDLCGYKSKQKGPLINHMVTHKNPSRIEWYKCDLCEYKSKRKSDLKRHMLTHKDETETKDPSEIKWYKCALCDYVSNIKSRLNRHKLKHQDPTEVQWHECGLCNFKSMYKSRLNRHKLKHKDPTEVQWYECGLCNFKSVYKNALTNHTLTHQDPAEVQWYECSLCDYKTRYKSVLKTHTVTHSDPTSIQWHECYLCDFKSMLKSHWKKHIQRCFRKT